MIEGLKAEKIIYIILYIKYIQKNMVGARRPPEVKMENVAQQENRQQPRSGQQRVGPGVRGGRLRQRVAVSAAGLSRHMKQRKCVLWPRQFSAHTKAHVFFLSALDWGEPKHSDPGFRPSRKRKCPTRPLKMCITKNCKKNAKK